ncbi:MAG: PepSY-like domain-containing protein [Bacteroidota bacterium]|nr:PepSY-like domain-containing protein [Bacteroidota bacterium]
MKKILGLTAILFALSSATFAQENEGGNEHINVPAVVKNANMKKYPESKTHHITWEKENGNYEANWGGKDGEANSVQYTPVGNFIEIVKAIPVSQLPKSAASYIKEHYKSAKFGDVGKVLDARGKTSYEVEINGKDKIFDANGNFVKSE